MFVVSETELGTPERRWQRASAVVEAKEMEWPSVTKQAPRLVVVSPHPDDETLAVGGTISMLARRGFRVEVVAVTDGEGSHPRSPTISPADLATRRAGEQVSALSELGPVAIHRLHITDGAVSKSNLAERLAPIVEGAAMVLAPFSRDGHPDHDAAGIAAEAAARRAHTPLVSYLVWAWHWAKPLDAALPWPRFRRVSLDAEACVVKARAVAKFESQLFPLSTHPHDAAILPPAVVARFSRKFETVIVP